jgi:hypothetical protein
MYFTAGGAIFKWHLNCFPHNKQTNKFAAQSDYVMIIFQYLELTNFNKICKILGSQSGIAENSGLSLCDAVSLV